MEFAINSNVVVQQDPKAKKIRTESGVWIPATYKTNRYSMWKEKCKINEDVSENDSEEESPQIQNCKSISLHPKNIFAHVFFISCVKFI